MLRGELYDASDPLLVKERQKARQLLYDLNIKNFGNYSAYKTILEDLLPHAASDIRIEPPFFCDYGYNIYTGANVYFNFNCILLDVVPIRIGSNVLFGPNVQIYTATHPTDVYERQKGLEYGKPISIGNDSWIGGGVIISPGITIGERCIVGAGSVVTKDIPANKIVAGNPAREISKHDK